MKEQRTLKGLEEIKQFFKSNKTPIYFISATNFGDGRMDWQF
jgi:hypothetical protein